MQCNAVQTATNEVPSNNMPRDDENRRMVMIDDSLPPRREMNTYFYTVFHVILTIVALYLSYRCNGGLNWIHAIFALFCPLIYILVMIASRGTCGIIRGERV